MWIPTTTLSQQGTLIQIFDSTLSVATASFDIQNIPSNYKHLWIIWQGRGDNATLQVEVVMRFNNDSGANYDYQTQLGDSTANTAGASVGATYLRAGALTA